MRSIHVSVRLSQPLYRRVSFESVFSIDGITMNCVAPASALMAAGIKPEGETFYQSGRGANLHCQFGLARIEFMGETTYGRIIFGPENSELLLGVSAMQSVGIIVDPKTRTLQRLPAIPLK